jgi:hypothetical protein
MRSPRTAAWSVTAGLVLSAATARAQSATSAGVAAFVRGDYATAAQVLQAITDRWPGPVDDEAAFFMATMYANGLGVAPDPVRACALFFRGQIMPAAGNPPFFRLNQALFGELQTRLGSTGQGDCLLLATLGLHHGFEPVTITLGPGHWIRMTLSGEKQNVVADIVYGGNQSQVEVGLSLSPGTRFLPVEHTKLQAGGTRHFLQFFQWIPEGSAWSLLWRLDEVVGDRLENVAGEMLYTADGTQPPRAPDFDVQRFVSLGVNQYGHVEWTVRPQGREARTDAIETDAERQELRAMEAARRKADAAFDRTYRRGAGIPPNFAYTLAEGCADIFANALTSDRTEAITVRVDRRRLGLDDRPWTFDLVAQVPGVEVTVHLFEVPRTRDSFCTDARVIDDSREEVWRAVGGSMTVQVGPMGAYARAPEQRRATIEIVGAEFLGPAGQRVRAPRSITITTTVGRIFG